MYAKCGSIIDSVLVFEKLPWLNHVSWNSMITGFVQNRLDHEALQCFERMQDVGFAPDSITLFYILISGYIQNGLVDEAVKCLHQMIDDGFSPNVIFYFHFEDVW